MVNRKLAGLVILGMLALITSSVLSASAASNTVPVTAIGDHKQPITADELKAPCSGPGSQTVVTNRDAYVQQQSPTANAGTGTTLIVQSRATGRNMRTLVYFPLPNLPSGCSLTSVTLRVYNKTPSGGRTIQALQITGSWTETGVTWSNQPATTGTAATSTSPSSASWQTWTVTEQVKAMYTGGNNGFLLRDQTEESATNRSQSYASREDTANDPELVVQWG